MRECVHVNVTGCTGAGRRTGGGWQAVDGWMGSWMGGQVCPHRHRTCGWMDGWMDNWLLWGGTSRSGRAGGRWGGCAIAAVQASSEYLEEEGASFAGCQGPMQQAQHGFLSRRAHSFRMSSSWRPLRNHSVYNHHQLFSPLSAITFVLTSAVTPIKISSL
jgi:hypothetical protein